MRSCASGTGGGEVELYAWGLRNPFGLIWSPDGKLYASENGLDERGVRHVAHAPDNLWEIKEGAWYGGPDFASGIPVADPRFRPKGQPSAEFFDEGPSAGGEAADDRRAARQRGEMDFSPSEKFGRKDQMFFAAWGDYAPGHRSRAKARGILGEADRPRQRKAEPFFHAKASALGDGELACVTTAGPKRPTDVRFHGDALYVVDIGAVTFTQSRVGPAPRPFPAAASSGKSHALPPHRHPAKTEK